MVYVAHADDMLTLTQKLKRDRDAAFSSANGHAVPAAPDHAFYIDRENYARMSGGERINAVEIDGQLMDLRGEGDLGAIIWADGSTGVLGKVLDIKPA
jgi:hypothetical protein